MDKLPEELAQNLDRSFPGLVEAMQSRLYTGLGRMFPGHAEDLTQETFIRAYQALTRYSAEQIRSLRLSGWLWTIALNLGRSHHRRQASRPTLDWDSVTEPGHQPPVPPDWAAWDRRLEKLSWAQRQTVVLRYIGEFSYPEISQMLDRPLATVRSDVSRGLQKLRQIMEREDA